MDNPDGRRLYPIDNNSYNTSEGNGACSALSVLWILAMHQRPSLAVAGLNALGSREYITRVQDEYEGRNHGNDEVKNILKPNGLQCLTKGSHPLEKRDLRSLMHVAFENFGTFYVSLGIKDGNLQHNVALSTGSHGYYLFDPNFGLYKAQVKEA